MAVKGALTTQFYISEEKPASQNEAGYEALRSKLITPSALDDTEDALTIPAADYNALLPGELAQITVAGGLTGLAINTPRYIVKRGSNEISFATSFAEAIKTANWNVVALGGSVGATSRVQVSHWRPCGEVTNVGEFGREYNTVTATNLKEGATRKFKGSYNNGTFTADLLFDAEDLGQTIIEEAEVSTDTYSFLVRFPGGTAAQRTVLTDAVASEDFYFEGLVQTVKRVVGGPDDALMLRTTVEIAHPNIIEGT